MPSSTKNDSPYLSANLPIILCAAMLLFTLFMRVTRGLDLTDEIQYYGQIKGLVESGSLFSNDLFIQQVVYVLLYPAFLLHHAWWGAEGLIFFGRLLMSALSVALFAYTCKKLMALALRPFFASTAALLVTFAITYHGVMAPSYNTISQACWIVFSISFLEWKKRPAPYWAALPLITAFAHPTSAVTMGLLLSARLLHEKAYREVFKFGLASLLGAAFILIAMCWFATPTEYMRSLSFSSGYGVGTVFFSSIEGPLTLVKIYALFGVAAVVGRIPGSYRLPALFITFIGVAVYNIRHPFPGGYDGYSAATALLLAALSALAYAGALCRVEHAAGPLTRRQVHWFALLLLAYATTLGVTSGNGIGQSTGAFMVGLPVLLAVACSSMEPKTVPLGASSLAAVCMIVTVVWTVGHWGRYPYREVRWWKADQSVQSIPEFRFISTSAARVAFLSRARDALLPDTQGKKVLVITEYPGLYFASGGTIESCMVYMHSITSSTSEHALKDCLQHKKPDVVIDVFRRDEQAYRDDRIKTLMRQFYAEAYPDCKRSTLEFDSHDDWNPDRLVILTCKPRQG